MTYQSGILADSNPVQVLIANTTLPATLTLTSTAPGRSIRLSANGGITFFTPKHDNEGTTADCIVVSLYAPVSHVEFTGVNGDVWGVR